MTDLSELLERVKVATGPDRELDAAIFAWSEGGRIRYFDAEAKNYVWERPIGGFWIRDVKSVPTTTKYTASIDAALALVDRCLPGSGWYVARGVANGVPATVAALYPDLKASEPIAKSKGETPALAILSALLQALGEAP